LLWGPPGLGAPPLCESLHTLGSETGRRAGLTFECRADASADHLPAPVAEALWRVAQEGVANIEMHAGAKTARVLLEFSTNGNASASALATGRRVVILRLMDDGVGLPAEAEQKPGHFGLRGLRERVEGVGGTFTVAPLNPRGTELLARIPVMA
jgi:two-component system, NarL family, sensor histidine kinase UhpB